MVMRRVRNERLNEIAQCVQSQWRSHVPLSVRYAAAEAADSIVADWFERVNELERAAVGGLQYQNQGAEK